MFAIKACKPVIPGDNNSRHWVNAVGRGMWPDTTTGITELLMAWSASDPSAFEKLTPLILGDLRRIAKCHLTRERTGHSLETTALVNEAYCV